MSQPRITVEALRYYVPIFQTAETAEQELLDGGLDIPAERRNHLETVIKLRELIVQQITDLCMPLITREINKIIAGSHLKSDDNTALFNLLLYAGLDGMRRGLRKFDVEKLNKSSTNYLFQWITTYAKKELAVLEAPFGIPPSRFMKYKKISAVRKKLTEELGRYAENEEVLEYFHSGKADIRTMNGPLGSSRRRSKENQAMTLYLVEEQENFERNMMNVETIDPLDAYDVEVRFGGVEQDLFQESAFGIFVTEYPVNPVAKAVLKSEVNADTFTPEEHEILEGMKNSEYRNWVKQWKSLIRDVHGPFYEFLKNNDGIFHQFNTKTVMESIQQSTPVLKSAYSDLFLKEERKK